MGSKPLETEDTYFVVLKVRSIRSDLTLSQVPTMFSALVSHVETTNDVEGTVRE